MKKVIDPDKLIEHVFDTDNVDVAVARQALQQYLERIPEVKPEDAGKYLERAMNAVFQWMDNPKPREMRVGINEFIAQWCRTNPNVQSLLVQALEEYAKLLGSEIEELAGIAQVHGWKSHRYEQGDELRKRIEELKSKA